MPCLAEQAMHQDELGYRPSHGLDGPLRNQGIIVQERHMRRVRRLCPADREPGLAERDAQSTLQGRHRADAFTSTQHERPISRPGGEAQRPIERYLEWRHCDGRCGFDRRGYDFLRQTWIVAEVIQSDVEALRLERFAFQTMLAAQMLRQSRDARRGGRIRENREKQAIREFRRGVESSQRELLRRAAPTSTHSHSPPP